MHDAWTAGDGSRRSRVRHSSSAAGWAEAAGNSGCSEAADASGPVTPGQGTTPESNGDEFDVGGRRECPNKLPETAAQKAEDEKQPDIPPPDEGPKAFTADRCRRTLSKFRSR